MNSKRDFTFLSAPEINIPIMRLQTKWPQFLFSSLALLAFTSDLRISAAHFPKRYRFAVFRPLSWHSPRALIVWILNQGPPWTRRVAGPCHHPQWRAHARAGCSSKSTAKRDVVMRFDNTPTTKRQNYNYNSVSTLFSISISSETVKYQRIYCAEQANQWPIFTPFKSKCSATSIQAAIAIVLLLLGLWDLCASVAARLEFKKNVNAQI